MPPSAAIVRAVRKMDCASSGKVSNSFSAALIHETGLVLRASDIRYFHAKAHVVISDNRIQACGACGDDT
jgi:hypothetical protein